MTFLVVSSLATIASYVPERSNHSVSNANAQGRLIPTYAGALYGLAVASKFQAGLFLPLVLGLALSSGWKKSEWTRWLAGFLPIIGLLIIWQLARGTESNLIETQFRSYGGLRLAWSWELWPRLQEWVGLWRQVIGSEVLEFMVLLSIPPFVALLIEQRDRSATLDRLFTLYVVAYLALHWFLALPVWDRYLLPLLPFIGLVLARFVWRVVMFAWPALSETLKLEFDIKKLTIGVLIVFFVLQAPAIIKGYRGQLPVGTSPEADEGAAEISSYLEVEPYGTVLYDHWYSWQWRYHLFDKRVFISWFPHPDALIEDLRIFGGHGNDRYLALPNSDQSVPVRRMLDAAGFTLTPIATAGNLGEHTGIVLYLVKP